jgi:uncharacterized membrane protein YeaQ/YmgE (transglycosylase-associated protein family)
MGILWTILIGFIIGVIAKFLMPGRDPGGFIITTVLGIAGSWVGGWISAMLGGSGTVGWIGSILGAMLLLWVYRMMNKKAA